MPLPFDFEGKGALNFDLIFQKKRSLLTTAADFSPYSSGRNCISSETTSCNGSFGGEPKSVLDSARFPSSRPTSSSTLSSPHCGGGGSSAFGGAGSTNPSPKWHQQDSATATSCSNLAAARDYSLNAVPHIGAHGGGGFGGGERLTMEDWESVLSEAAASGHQDPSVLRWIMGDVPEDPNKALHLGGGSAGNNCPELDFNGGNGGFGVVDQESFSLSGVNLLPNVPILDGSPNPMPTNNLLIPFDSSPLEAKLPFFNSPLLLHHHQQTPSPAAFPLPFSSPPDDQNYPFFPPQPKRHNPGPFSFEQPHHQLQFLPHYTPGPVESLQKPNPGEDLGQQAIVDQIFEAAELVQSGNTALAQGILARLNHRLSPTNGNKPFQRAAFYFEEALHHVLLRSSNNNSTNGLMSLVLKIGAHKSLSEISPVLQFANLTCNQAVLEALEGLNRVHVVDFDLGLGGHWAPLVQELGSKSLRITAVVNPSSHDRLELRLARENLVQFAAEANVSFEFNAVSFDSLDRPFHSSEEAVVVNLPAGVIARGASVLTLVKQLCPRIVVSVDKGCDRSDLPFANRVVHGLQSYSNLLESLDAVRASEDAMQKIERFLLQPEIEKLVGDGFLRFREKGAAQHWRALMLGSGFRPVGFSGFAETQAECIAKRAPVRGFAVERRQHSLVLCWQRKELVSASAWRY